MAVDQRSFTPSYTPTELDALSPQSREIIEQIYDAEIWADGVYKSQFDEDYIFTPRDVAETIDNPDNWISYNWDRVENALQEAEDHDIIESGTLAVDITLTEDPTDSLYTDVNFYRLLEEPVETTEPEIRG